MGKDKRRHIPKLRLIQPQKKRDRKWRENFTLRTNTDSVRRTKKLNTKLNKVTRRKQGKIQRHYKVSGKITPKDNSNSHLNLA